MNSFGIQRFKQSLKVFLLVYEKPIEFLGLLLGFGFVLHGFIFILILLLFNYLIADVAFI